MYAKPSKVTPWKFYVFGSGSTGNAMLIIPPKGYVKGNGCGILIDCGVKDIGLKIDCFLDKKVPLHVLITHTHSDHIKNIRQLARQREDITVHGTKEVCDKLDLLLDRTNAELREWSCNEWYLFDGYAFMCIPSDHDVDGSVHWVVSDGNKTVLFGSDTHTLSDAFLEIAKDADVVFTECNYDEEWMLNDTDPLNYTPNLYVYDDELKERITKKAHTSNQYIKSLLDEKKLLIKKTILMHLSRTYNSSEVVSNRIHGVLIGTPERDLPLRWFTMDSRGRIRDKSVDLCTAIYNGKNKELFYQMVKKRNDSK